MTIVDWLVIVTYAAAMLGVGWYYSRQNETSDDYHLGGRRMSPLAIGLSLFATLTSALSYLAVPGEIVKNGPMAMAQILVFPLIVVVVGYNLIRLTAKQFRLRRQANASAAGDFTGTTPTYHADMPNLRAAGRVSEDCQ